MFVPSRTPIIEEVTSAMRAVGVEVALDGPHLVIDGNILDIEVIERAHPTPADLERIEPARDNQLRIVVADRISGTGRDVLRSRSIGWLDRRGHLRLWARGLRLEVPFTPIVTPAGRRVTSVTPAVRDVVFAMLTNPVIKPSPRGLGALLERSPGYVSTILTGLAEDGLLDDNGFPLLPDLFWMIASHWPTDWVYLADSPDFVASICKGLVTGGSAAARWGAPLLPSASETIHMQLASDLDLRRVLERSTQSARRNKAQTAVRVLGPLYALAGVASTGNRVAGPLLCALDLAVDQRGRETISGWRARNIDLGVVAYLEIARRVGFTGTWMSIVDEVMARPISTSASEALAAYGWSQPRVLGEMFQHPATHESLRQALLQRLEALVEVDVAAAATAVHAAPSLAIVEPFRSLSASSPRKARDRMEGLADEASVNVQQAFRDGGTVAAATALLAIADQLCRAVAEADELSNGQELWERSALAAFLMRAGGIADYSGHIRDALSEIAKTPRRGAGRNHLGWTQWSSGPQPQWMELAKRARNLRSASAATRRQLVAEISSAELADQAIPLCELLRDATIAERQPMLDGILAAAQAMPDLHLRAKVLAEASQFAEGLFQTRLLDAALAAGRAAVRQTGGSLVVGPEHGGIHGLLEVVPHLSGSRRKDVLSETAALWIEWVNPDPTDLITSRRRRPDRRMLFDGAGDSTRPLISWLAEEGLAIELRLVLSTIREVAGNDGNALEVMLAYGAWPTLLDGDIEVAAAFVAETRAGSPYMTERRAEHVGDTAVAGDAPPYLIPDFPDELLGFRNVWQ